MFKFGRVAAIFIASIGSIFTVTLISEIISFYDPNWQKMWAAILAATIMSQLVIKK